MAAKVMVTTTFWVQRLKAKNDIKIPATDHNNTSAPLIHWYRRAIDFK
jgi:hypothetical protein